MIIDRERGTVQVRELSTHVHGKRSDLCTENAENRTNISHRHMDEQRTRKNKKSGNGFGKGGTEGC